MGRSINQPFIVLTETKFSYVKTWGGTAQITTQGHRGPFFRVVFRYLAIAAQSLSGPLETTGDGLEYKIFHHLVLRIVSKNGWPIHHILRSVTGDGLEYNLKTCIPDRLANP